MNILILGYYNKFNFGDDCFQDSFRLIFKNNVKLKFLDIDLVKTIDLNYYNCIIIGGGDLVNDYFKEKLIYIRSIYQKCIYGYGLGIPYRSLIEKNYLLYYDHVFTRNKSYLLDISQTIGSKYTHYLPDIVMQNFTINDNQYFINNKTIGVFLACSLLKDSIIENIVLSFNKILKDGYKLHLIAFDTNNQSDITINDIHINTLIYNKLDNKENVINDTKRYNPNEMYSLIKTFSACICSRFHSHILCIIAGIPFISFSYTNKCNLLLLENNYNYNCIISNTIDCKADNFDPIVFNNIFIKLNNNLLSVREQLLKIAKRDQLLLDNNILENIIQINERRIIEPNYIFIDRVDILYNKYKNYKNDNENLAKDVLYDITHELSSKYIYGMVNNLNENKEKLRDMIDYIYKDKREKILKIPNVNLKITSTHQYYDIHRSGWQFAIESIQNLHSDYGPIMDIYCDSTFGWTKETCKNFGIIPYTQPWCGFFHHTPNKEYSSNNINNSTQTIEFIKSLETCIGLFTLSEDLAIWLSKRIEEHGYKIPIVPVYHPTALNVKQFDIKILKSKEIKIYNVGAWLRNSYSIYRAKFNSKFKKYRLKGKDMNNYFPPNNLNIKKEDITSSVDNSFLYCLYQYIIKNNYLIKELKVNFDDIEYEKVLNKYINKQIRSVTILDFLPNDEYDNLLSQNICFLDLIECSAVNTLIECIARCNPIIVNRLPAVVEYIGADYPLLYDKIEELETLVNIENLKKANEYLRVNTYLKQRLSSESFYDSIYNSEILNKSVLIN